MKIDRIDKERDVYMDAQGVLHYPSLKIYNEDRKATIGFNYGQIKDIKWEYNRRIKNLLREVKILRTERDEKIQRQKATIKEKRQGWTQEEYDAYLQKVEKDLRRSWEEHQRGE